MRFAIPLLAALALVASAGCGGGDGTAQEEPAALEQRIVTEADAPGSKPDPVEKPPDDARFRRVHRRPGRGGNRSGYGGNDRRLQQAGFEGAIIDTRFFGATHRPGTPHIVSSVIRLQSEEGAANALEWIEADSVKPCPKTCAVKISEFMDGVPDARGVRRSASAYIPRRRSGRRQAVRVLRNRLSHGSFVYTLDPHGAPDPFPRSRRRTSPTLYERISDLTG